MQVLNRHNNSITSLLVAVNIWRILGVAFLWGGFSGNLTSSFWNTCRSRGYFDRSDSILFAYFLRKGYSWSKYAVVIWSVLGITDLVYAVSFGLITGSEFGISTMTTFPWILVPTVGVPLALMLHGITLYRLRNPEFPSQQ